MERGGEVNKELNMAFLSTSKQIKPFHILFITILINKIFTSVKSLTRSGVFVSMTHFTSFSSINIKFSLYNYFIDNILRPGILRVINT